MLDTQRASCLLGGRRCAAALPRELAQELRVFGCHAPPPAVQQPLNLHVRTGSSRAAGDGKEMQRNEGEELHVHGSALSKGVDQIQFVITCRIMKDSTSARTCCS